MMDIVTWSAYPARLLKRGGQLVAAAAGCVAKNEQKPFTKNNTTCAFRRYERFAQDRLQ
jgi:hypothetical protein